MQITRHETGTRMSQAVVAGNLVFLAGQVASGAPGASVREQTINALENVTRLLAKAGSHPTCIVSATIWLSDISTFDEMNAVWDAWLPKGHAPARATIESRLAGAEYAVEIGIVAALV